MYYSQDIIDEVIAANDVVDVIGGYVQLKRAGSGYMGLCPFHGEKTPSFSVSPSRQTFHCFGCGEGGNVLTFLMKYENATFQEALKQLADRAGITLPEPDVSAKAKERGAQRERLLAVNREAAAYYYRLLRAPGGQKGLRYFTERGLSEKTMQSFGLGYADGASSDLVRHLRGKEYSDEDILAAGVAVFDEKRGLHDRFWNRVMFPIMDTSNRVVGFGGRVMGDAQPKYLNSPETPVFDKSRNLYGLNIARRTRTGSFILCEGYMDVIAMHQAGFTQAVASLGTAFTESQAAILRRYVRQVLLAYDSDSAGVSAALRNIEILNRAGLTGKVVNLEPYKDPDEFVKGLGAQELQKRLDGAENSFFFQIRQLAKNYTLQDPASRTEFYHEIAKRLCGFGDEIERDSYIRAIAEKYFIDEGMLRREVARYGQVYGAGDAGDGRSGVYAAAGSRWEKGSSLSRRPSGTYGNAGTAGYRQERPGGSGAKREEVPASEEAPRGAPDRSGSVTGYGDIPSQGQSAAKEGSGRAAGGSRRSQAVRSNEELLLTWIADDPELYPQIRAVISAEDFTEGVTQKAARRYFDILERESGDSLAAASGNAARPGASPALVIASFEDEEEQREAAALFETRLPGIHPAGREKALRDILGNVKSAHIQRISDGLTDPAALQQLVREKKALQTIRVMPLRLRPAEEDEE